MKNYHQKLIPGNFYHVYNRAIANESLFLNDDNYMYFLSKFSKYIVPIAETICYCLMGNHFHFLIRIKDEKDLKFFKNKAIQKSKTLENILSQQFSNLFNTYAQAFNKQQKRKGSLFMKNYNRLLISDELYIRKLILYIHYNPIDSGLVNNLNDWKYSSFRLLSKGFKDANCSYNAITYFNDLENFVYCHSNPSSA